MKRLFKRALARPADLPADPELAATLTALTPPRGIAALAAFEADGPPTVASTGRSVGTELFELGSVTKTITATALAQMVTEGRVDFGAQVGDILGGRAGRAGRITLLQLATHTSGLPKLAPNAMRPPFWPRDPYRFYDERRLWQGLAEVELSNPGRFSYSNLGYALLGQCLSDTAAVPIAQLLEETILRPAGMATARCQPTPRGGLVRGHGHWLTAGRRWHQPLPGAGGIDASIADLAAWTSTNRYPESSPLRDAVQLAQRTHHEEKDIAIGLAWVKTRGTIWHNGGTGGFSSFVGMSVERAIGALSSHAPTPDYELDSHAHAYLAGPSEWRDRSR